MAKKATRKKAKKAEPAPQPQIPLNKRLDDKEMALALSAGKDNPQIRAIFQILEDAEKASLSQLARPEFSSDHGTLAHLAGNYGQVDYIKGEIEDRIKASSDVLMGRVAQGSPPASY
jgi:hypothetical protein